MSLGSPVDFNGIRLIRGPSLLADSSCVVASVRFSRDDQQVFSAGDAQALPAVEALAERLELDARRELAGSDSVPLVVTAASWLAEGLLHRLDSFLSESRIETDATRQVFHIVIPEYNHYIDVPVLHVALSLAASVFPGKLQQRFPSVLTNADPLSNYQRLVEVSRQYRKKSFTRNVISSLIRSNGAWFPLDRYSKRRDQIQIGYGRFQQVLDGSTSFQSSYCGISVSLSKIESRQFLADLGFPVTQQVVVANPEAARRAAETMGFPVVVKTDYGAHGSGVICGLNNGHEVVDAFQQLARGLSQKGRNASILVEKFVAGNDYRITIVNGQLHNVFRRIPAMVLGDGKHKVSDLVEIENRNPLRGNKESETSAYAFLQLGQLELNTLKHQGYSPDSIPTPGAEVLLRSNANWSAGGTVEGVEKIHPDNAALAQRVAQALNIDILGVDIITPDIGRSFMEGDLTILEVNHSPGISGFYGKDGTYVNTAIRAVEMIVSEAANQQVPLVVSLAGAVSQAFTSLVASALKTLGYQPGVVNESGMEVAGMPWALPDSLDYRDPAFTLLRNRQIDAAVIERSVSQLLEHGVGSGGCDVAVVLDTSPGSISTKLWPEGIDSLQSVRMLAKHCSKACVALIDDPGVAACLEDIPASKLCAISTAGWSETIQRQAESGSAALVLESLPADEFLLRYTEFGAERVNDPEEMRVSFDDASEAGVLVRLAALATLLCNGHTLQQAATACSAGTVKEAG